MKEYFKNCERHFRGKDDKTADMYAFLATLEREDYNLLFDTSIFNDIAEAYVHKALCDCVEDGYISQEQAECVLLRHGKLFDILSAEEVQNCDKDLVQVDQNDESGQGAR